MRLLRISLCHIGKILSQSYGWTRNSLKLKTTSNTVGIRLQRMVALAFLGALFFASAASAQTSDTVFTSNPKDPRLKAYRDSLEAYKTGILVYKEAYNDFFKDPFNPSKKHYPTRYKVTSLEQISKNLGFPVGRSQPVDERLEKINQKFTPCGVYSFFDSPQYAYRKPSRVVLYRQEETRKDSLVVHNEKALPDSNCREELPFLRPRQPQELGHEVDTLNVQNGLLIKQEH